MSTYQVGDKVSKVNIAGGNTGSAKVYEIATVNAVASLDQWDQAEFAGLEVVYTVRKVGGRGKGGCWYTEAQLAPAQD